MNSYEYIMQGKESFEMILDHHRNVRLKGYAIHTQNKLTYWTIYAAAFLVTRFVNEFFEALFIALSVSWIVEISLPDHSWHLSGSSKSWDKIAIWVRPSLLIYF